MIAEDLVHEQLAQAKREDICVTSSFQAEDMVVVHMVREVFPEVPVIFLDTGYHFAETYEYRDRLAGEWHLNLINILPSLTVAEQESQFGILNQTAPDRCCGMRKVGPLFASLEPYSVWFTGLRREQAKTRANMKAVDAFTLPSGKQLQKISPLADWTTRDVWQYAEQHNIPLMKL
jgi:phosphoadenosine phosphosulfate reductase